MSKVTDKDTKSTLYCSFCGKSQHEVRKLIAGPTVFICDGCVELCKDIIQEELLSSSPTPNVIYGTCAGIARIDAFHAVRNPASPLSGSRLRFPGTIGCFRRKHVPRIQPTGGHTLWSPTRAS